MEKTPENPGAGECVLPQRRLSIDSKTEKMSIMGRQSGNIIVIVSKYCLWSHEMPSFPWQIDKKVLLSNRRLRPFRGLSVKRFQKRTSDCWKTAAFTRNRSAVYGIDIKRKQMYPAGRIKLDRTGKRWYNTPNAPPKRGRKRRNSKNNTAEQGKYHHHNCGLTFRIRIGA